MHAPQFTFSQLTFVDFLESLVRLANAIPIPSDEDMREVKVKQNLHWMARITIKT